MNQNCKAVHAQMVFNSDVRVLERHSSLIECVCVNSAADTRTQLQQPVLINTKQCNSHSESNVTYTVESRPASAGVEA